MHSILLDGAHFLEIVFQQSKTHFTVNLLLYKKSEVKKEFLEKKVIQGIKHACFNEKVTIEINFIDSIPPLPSGKNPAFILKNS